MLAHACPLLPPAHSARSGEQTEWRRQGDRGQHGLPRPPNGVVTERLTLRGDYPAPFPGLRASKPRGNEAERTRVWTTWRQTRASVPERNTKAAYPVASAREV